MFVRLACLFAVAAAGCGPLSRPMPERPDDATQAKIDQAWDAALAPVAKHDRQTWLDVFVIGYAHEYGVDTLVFRSEKRFSGGTVVMEVRYDRAKPAEDRFTMTVLDPAGKIVRHERYDREDVRRTYEEVVHVAVDPQDPQGTARRQAAAEARQERARAAWSPPVAVGPN